jgi:hypothetical protein
MVKLNKIIGQEEGYYHIVYRNHPHSDEDFSYIDTFDYMESSHQAHVHLKNQKERIDDPAVSEYDLGVGLTIPVNHLVQKMFNVETLEELRQLDRREVVDKLRSKRPIVSERDFLDVADRKERIERSQMGEDVNGIVSVDLDKI